MNHRGFDWLRVTLTYWGTDVCGRFVGKQGLRHLLLAREKFRSSAYFECARASENE